MPGPPAYPVPDTGPDGGNSVTFGDEPGIVAAVDLEGYQGDHRPLVIPLDRWDGAPLPLLGDGWRVDAQVRKHPTPMSPLLHYWTTHPSAEDDTPRARFVELDPVDGHDHPHYGIELAVDDSRGWAWCGIPAGWDLHLTDPAGHSSPIMAGACYWHPTFTWVTPVGAP